MSKPVFDDVEVCGVQVHTSNVGAVMRLEGIAVDEDGSGEFLVEVVLGELEPSSVG